MIDWLYSWFYLIIWLDWILDYILDYGSCKTACRAILRIIKCTKNPLRVYTKSISGVQRIRFGCTPNPSQVYKESASGVHQIHLRCTENPFRVYTKSMFFAFIYCFSTFYQHFFNIASLFRFAMRNFQWTYFVEKFLLSFKFNM